MTASDGASTSIRQAGGTLSTNERSVSSHVIHGSTNQRAGTSSGEMNYPGGGSSSHGLGSYDGHY